MYDSPYVRRVAVSMQLLGISFEHADWSVGKDFDRIRQYNPLGRVPTLVLDDGEVLCESAVILDYLDDRVGPARALLAASGPARRAALKLMALAVGAVDKGRDQIYERVFRPPGTQHEPWLARLRSQMNGGLDELERFCEHRGDEPWLVGNARSQADITLACVFTFLNEALPAAAIAARYARLAAVAARCEATLEFQCTHVPFYPPA
jgi:glutathione S-transferase